VKLNDKTISSDLFTLKEENQSDVFSFNKLAPIGINTVSGLFILYSVFSLFILSFVSVLFTFGIETELLSNVVTYILSAAVIITASLLLYATAMIIE